MALATSTWVAAETYSGEGSLQGNVTIEIALEPIEGVESVRVVVESRVRRGEATWSLVDPDGERVFEGGAAKGRVSLDSGELEAKPGVWRLSMEASGVKMRYEVETFGLVEIEDTSK